MKSLHWQEHNHFMHFGPEGLNILAFDPIRLDGAAQFAFDFGDSARERTSVALTNDLVKRVHDQFADGTTVGDLLQNVANETPATRDMIRNSLFELGAKGALDVRTSHGRLRKHVNRLQLGDEVHPRRQFILL